MKEKIIFSLLALGSIGTIAAAPVSPEEALLRLEKTNVRQVRSDSQPPRLIETKFDESNKPVMYIFSYSGENGFMILSADDAVAPLLGYSETGKFGGEDNSPSFESWLSFYTAQISDLRDAPKYVATATRADEWAAISPMIKSEWGQTTPYNNECPLIGNRRAATGCVATAMAQVMRYWKYPASGKGSITYKSPNVSGDLFIDFEATEFDWGSMQDFYRLTYSDKAAKAVATLMKACGYSVKMTYDAFESGAYSKDIPAAFYNHLGYDSGVSRKLRSAYDTQDAWNKMIYDELASVGPVIYNGQSPYGGHSFVCDGYDGKGYFHINWGWSGLSNGYFLLNELNPSEVGTGGHTGGYTGSQEVVVGIMPPVGRLTLGNLSIDNAAEDSGNVKGWGYTYRINDFNNIVVSVDLQVNGGHISSPLYVTVYETDPDTKKNGAMVVDQKFDSRLDMSDGTATFTQKIGIKNFDISKFYTLTVAYELKGQRTTVGNIRLAVSSGVDDVIGGYGSLSLFSDGGFVKAEGEGRIDVKIYNMGGSLVAQSAGLNPVVSTSQLSTGVYLVKATSESGVSRTLRLLLK